MSKRYTFWRVDNDGGVYEMSDADGPFMVRQGLAFGLLGEDIFMTKEEALAKAEGRVADRVQWHRTKLAEAEAELEEMRRGK